MLVAGGFSEAGEDGRSFCRLLLGVSASLVRCRASEGSSGLVIWVVFCWPVENNSEIVCCCRTEAVDSSARRLRFLSFDWSWLSSRRAEVRPDFCMDSNFKAIVDVAWGLWYIGDRILIVIIQTGNISSPDRHVARQSLTPPTNTSTQLNFKASNYCQNASPSRRTMLSHKRDH